MTIALGLVCDEGLVLCADTQEAIPGYIKQDRPKLDVNVYLANVQDGSMACGALVFVGAGVSDYIKTAIQHVVRGSIRLDDLDSVEKLLQSRLLEFFNEHMAPWAYFPESERPSVEMLIGAIVNDGEHALYHYCGTAFHRTESKAIGTGVLLANGLIDEYILPHPKVTLEELKSLGVYILRRVKDRVDSCGGWTNLVVLDKKGEIFQADAKQLAKMESEFAKIDWKASATLREKITKTVVPTDSKVIRTGSNQYSIQNVNAKWRKRKAQT